VKVSMVIPAKGKSLRVENKNLSKINGKTLIERACEKALQCKYINRVYLDTESPKIALHVEHLCHKGLEILMRPKELADNNTGANEMLVYAMHAIDDCDLILQTFATSPLITSETIDMAIEKFLQRGHDHDSFFSVVPVQEYFWNDDNTASNFDFEALPNSFELPMQYQETHGIYGVYTKTLLEQKTRVGKNPMLIPISKLESIDIDDMEDLQIAERLLSHELN
jgi:CMP-N-acetylneuraminic acid synthetase